MLVSGHAGFDPNQFQPNAPSPHPFMFGLSPIPLKPLRGLGDEAGDPLGSQEHAQFTAHSGKFVLGAPPTRRYGVALAEDGDSANRAIPLSFSNSPPAVNATSSDELQSAAWGGGELHGSKSRNCTTSFVAPILSGSSCGVRPGHRRCPAASPAARRTAKATPYF